jgi:rod shape-determining protein MreD
MMEKAPRRRIDREPTSAQLIGIPVASVMIASLLPLLPIISTSPVIPPLGYMMLIGWRLAQRTMWPIWMPIPLGLFDDMFSGQPIGSAVFLWTSSFFILDLLDRRMLWRDFRQDWSIAALLIFANLLGALWIANFRSLDTSLVVLMPQIILSILVFPAVSRLVAHLNRIRLSA